nr:alpha/beta fold hydrolase [Tateyamaria sp. ANG-S1]
MIHGLGCTGSVWGAMQAHLAARGMTCLAPTLLEMLRPRSPSVRTAPEIGFPDFVEEARTFCRISTSRTGLPPVVIGHSMGGLIAQVLAVEGLCSKAVFLAPAPPKAIRNRSVGMLWCFANVLFSGDETRYHRAWRTGAKHVLFHRLPTPQQDRAHAQMVFEPGKLFADMANGIEVRAKDLRIPTLTVAARRDRAVPARVVGCITDYYSRAPQPTTLKIYDQHGHWLLDEPDSAQLFDDVADWIEIPMKMNMNEAAWVKSVARQVGKV